MASAVLVVTPDNVRLMKDYYMTSHKHFDVDIKPMNLTRPHEELRANINNWISKCTKGFVKQLVPTGSVNTTIQMLIVCVVYLKVNLESPFYSTHSTNELFYVTRDPDEVRVVKTMHQINTHRYEEFENLQCQVVELKLTNPSLCCLILLPYTGDGLPDLEGKLPTMNFVALLENTRYAKVKVSIPSFHLQEKYDLCDYLESMGLASLGNCHDCPLKKVSQCEPPMSVTQFNHEFYFELPGETANPFERVKQPDDLSDTFVFRADHPFLFVILDKGLKMAIAFGRLNCQDRFTTPIFHQRALDQRDEQVRHCLEAQAALGEGKRGNTSQILPGEKSRRGVRFNVESDQVTCPLNTEFTV